jgi:hypothetical protein
MHLSPSANPTACVPMSPAPGRKEGTEVGVVNPITQVYRSPNIPKLDWYYFMYSPPATILVRLVGLFV